jgi:hypothetical protein
MRHADSSRYFSSGAEGLPFSAALVGAVVAIASVLYAIDMAAVRALLSLP